MRLIIFTLEFPPQLGGIQTVAFQLCKEFTRLGVEVTVVTGFDDRAAAFDAAQRYKIIRVPIRETESVLQKIRQKLDLWRGLETVVRETQAEAVLCCSWDPCGYIASWLNLENRRVVPYFLLAHGMELVQLPNGRVNALVKKQIRGRAFANASKIFAVSGYTAKCVAELGISRNQIQVIQNGIDCNIVGSPESIQDGTKGKILLTVSRLVKRKGHDLVLRALPDVLEQLTVQYIVVGDGPERGSLEHFARELGVRDHVLFCGAVSDAEKQLWLQKCDLFVMPCRENPHDFEGFGIAYLEAMAYGKAVLGSPTGGVPDVILHGRTGWMVKPESPDELATAIINLLRDSELRSRLGNLARERVLREFCWQQIARRYLAEMECVL